MLESLSYDVPLVSNRYAHRCIEFLKTKGVKEELFKAYIPENTNWLVNPEAYLSINEILPLLELVKSLLTDDTAAFEFGQQLDLGAHGLFGYTLLSNSDITQIVTAIVRHMSISLPLLNMTVTRNGSYSTIDLDDNWNLGSCQALIVKTYMGSIHTAASISTDEMTFRCSFEQGETYRKWRSLAPACQFEFNCPRNQVIIPIGANRPSQTRHQLKVVHSLMSQKRQSYAVSKTERSSSGDQYTKLVRELITKSPKHANAERIATSMNIGPRRLRQLLAMEGTTFRDICNEAKKEIAQLYVTETPLPLNIISERLGFSDQAGFTRAYRSWMGMTPGEARKKAD